jgi:hypothetical protein
MRKQLANAAGRERKCAILNQVKIIEPFLAEIHHGLAGEFASLLRLLFELKQVGADALERFWLMVIRQDSSTIDLYLKAFELLFSSSPGPKTKVLWRIMANSPTFPIQVCTFLRTIVPKGTCRQHMNLYNELVRYAEGVDDPAHKKVITETLVALVPNDPEYGDSLFLKFLDQIKTYEDPPFLFALMKASCKCMNAVEAHDCFVKLAVVVPTVGPDRIGPSVDTLLILAKKSQTPLTTEEFSQFAGTTEALVNLGAPDVIRYGLPRLIDLTLQLPCFPEICGFAGRTRVFTAFPAVQKFRMCRSWSALMAFGLWRYPLFPTMRFC